MQQRDQPMGEREHGGNERGRQASTKSRTDGPRSHPIGTGAGAAGGAAAGAALGGALGGPPGAALGGLLGAIGGGAAGDGLAEAVNPSAHDRYWRQNYRARAYTDDSAAYDLYRPAYRFGWEARVRYFDRHWDDVEPTLAREWETRHESELTWPRAREAARDAWTRVDTQMNE